MKQGNLNIRCTEDYAVLYWDKPAAAPSGAEYTVSLNGEAVGRTDRTHFTIEGLSYGSSFRVDVVSGSYCIGSATLQFGREKRRIDITAAPYFCKGDGHILNTDNLQRAINDCGADDILYVPAGDFLTGALRPRVLCWGRAVLDGRGAGHAVSAAGLGLSCHAVRPLARRRSLAGHGRGRAHKNRRPPDRGADGASG